MAIAASSSPVGYIGKFLQNVVLFAKFVLFLSTCSRGYRLRHRTWS